MGRLFDFTRSEAYYAVTKSKKISNIPFTEAARKEKYSVFLFK